MAIDGASDPVVRLAIFDRQQPHDHIRPQRNTHLWPTPRHHDRLTNSEPMSRHGGYLGWHRTENNGAAGTGRASRKVGAESTLLSGARRVKGFIQRSWPV